MMTKKLSILFFLFLSVKGFSQQEFPVANPFNCNLFPQQNAYRNTLNISGIWNFKVDSADIGEQEKWFNGLQNYKPIAVPASWNEQYDELRDYMGKAWYQQSTFVPKNWKGQKIFIRFGSANYAAKVWINGKPLGKHEGGHLPFSFDISSFVNFDAENTIVVEVENFLKANRVPPGGLTNEGHFKNFPAGNFDFFPYCGLQRTVWLYSVPSNYINDINITTNIQNKDGIVTIKIKKEGNATGGKLVLTGNNQSFEKTFSFKNNDAEASITVPEARLWNTEDPYLYNLNISLISDKKIADNYSLKVGIRTIEVINTQVLLNGKPIFLKGFGKHEDFPIIGRGTCEPVIIKDYSLLKWIGANSFRTSHYPYDEAYMDLADELGILIVDEIPAVGLYFDKNIDLINQRKEICKQQIADLIARDKNHPSVIMWSVANEPGLGSASLKKDTKDSVSFNFFKELINVPKTLDATRPATIVTAENAPLQWLGLADVICINRYFGWYSNTGNIAEGTRLLGKELDNLHSQFNKPIMLTEFGADAQAGLHADNPEMFTEEYQRDFIKSYIELVATKSYMCGTHVWAFADFKTSQGDRRFGGYNWKGVFTRDRKPKLAAHYLKSKWAN